MPKNNRSKNTNRRDRTDIPIGVLWLAASLFLVIVAAVGIVLIRRNQQALTAMPLQVNAVEAWTFYQHGAIFVDVRPTSKWDGYHITSSKSIPLAELPSRLKELPHHAPIVVVDDNTDLSPKARDLLLKAGFTQVTALSGGIDAWIQGGYPFEGTFPF
jgi:rhodanese-related sulfurtransferase